MDVPSARYRSKNMMTYNLKICESVPLVAGRRSETPVMEWGGGERRGTENARWVVRRKIVSSKIVRDG